MVLILEGVADLFVAVEYKGPTLEDVVIAYPELQRLGLADPDAVRALRSDEKEHDEMLGYQTFSYATISHYCKSE